MTKQSSGIDGRMGRLVALLVILVCIASLGFINRANFFGSNEADVASINPELAACLEVRVGAVDKMRRDNVINDAQYELFRGRADAYCETEFGENSAPTLDPY